MNYKLLASDIDGTLITSGQELTEATVSAISSFKEKGGFFTLSTGRPIMGISRYIHLVSPGVPIISYNGAMIIRPDNGEIIYERGLEENTACEIINRGKKRGATVIVWAKNRLYTSEINEYVEQYSHITGEKVNLIEEQKSVVQLGITKCLWLDSAENIAEYGAELKTEPIKNVNFCTSTPNLLEFMGAGVSKGEGLKKVCEYCGIDISQAVAVGDEMNDMSMIQAAGFGVAMGNAHSEIKNVADYITITNDEDGLADMINKHML